MNHNNDIPRISDLRLLDIDVDKEWAKFSANAGIKQGKAFRLSTFWKAAASIVLIIGAGLIAYSQFNAPKTETHVACQEAIEATVEKSTQISLNRNSRITCTVARPFFFFVVMAEFADNVVAFFELCQYLVKT